MALIVPSMLMFAFSSQGSEPTSHEGGALWSRLLVSAMAGAGVIGWGAFFATRRREAGKLG